MQEPAACGARPAQQDRLHIAPVDAVVTGRLVQRIDASTVAPSATRARRHGRDHWLFPISGTIK